MEDRSRKAKSESPSCIPSLAIFIHQQDSGWQEDQEDELYI